MYQRKYFQNSLVSGASSRGEKYVLDSCKPCSMPQMQKSALASWPQDPFSLEPKEEPRQKGRAAG